MLKPVEQLDTQDYCELLLNLEQQRANLDNEIRSIKDRIAASVGIPMEGAYTADLPEYKVHVNQPIYRRVDESALSKIDVSDVIKHRVFRAKHEVNLKEWRYFSANEPDLFSELAKAVTEKPGAVSVKVERRDS